MVQVADLDASLNFYCEQLGMIESIDPYMKRDVYRFIWPHRGFQVAKESLRYWVDL